MTRTIRLPSGTVLELALHGGGADARVDFHDGALEIGGTFAGASVADDDPTIALTVRHPIAVPTTVWVPHLTPEPGYVMGDAVFRSPAIVVADGSLALAFVPDLEDVQSARGWRTWLDYDHLRREVTLAAGDYRQEGHVFYVREPPRGVRGEHLARLRLHVVASTYAEDLEDPYGVAARFVWRRWGHPIYARDTASPQRLAPLMEHVVRWAFSNDEGWGESVWQRVDLPDASTSRSPLRGATPAFGGSSTPAAGAPVFIVDVTRHPSVPPAERRWREPRSIWNQAWFSTQRCANGLLRYARQTRSSDLEERARQMTAIALAAPQADGLFPSVLVSSEEKEGQSGPTRWRWSSSNRRPPTVSDEACHLVDAAFTCRMLLEWDALTHEPRARAYVARFVDRLLRLQRPSGAFPGWVEPDGRVAPELAEGPESAVAALLLLELARTPSPSKDPAEYEQAAFAALAFLEPVAREGQWEDFETYYSCAPWGAPELLGRRVARNGVFKQNTLSIAWCADAFLHAWRVRREERWLRLLRRCASELVLHQAVWNPPMFPALAHGGFGVMNADSEWNDARQSLFAPLLLDLGRETGVAELTERGVSAVRASFSMLYCPENAALARAYEAKFPFFGPESYGFMMENQGHGSVDDPIGTFTIFTWGNGSALATAATVRDRFPEVARACGL